MKHIKNFSIIAHIDHGKSTLADRFIEETQAVATRSMTHQFLDNMDIERERGITIKAQTVRLSYSLDGIDYQLNLIDTPGHVDFTYEVSRSLACCEGALLVVDASQGIQAQTLANVYQALDYNLEIIPVINKIDLPHADVERVKKEIEDIIGLDASDAPLISAKTGLGVQDLLKVLVKKIPSPKGLISHDFQALIFDSWFDPYQGVVILVRVFEGKVTRGQKIYFKHTNQKYEVIKIAIQSPFFQEIDSLEAGEVGILICGIKNLRDIKIGDTLVFKENTPALAGYKDIKPMVFCGLFPVNTEDFESLKEALEKLSLNDSSFTYVMDQSLALGLGYRCGFLGLLHMNIIQERLEREFQLNLISTAPSCSYELHLNNKEILLLDNPSKFPEQGAIDFIKEPFVKMTLHVPQDFLGNIIQLCQERRGIQRDMQYLTSTRVMLTYLIPLNEMMFDFYDQLKSLSKGYASMDYELTDYETSDLVKLDILLNGEKVDALSLICHRSQAYNKGRDLTQRLQKIIERQQFEVIIQAAIGQKVLARETIKALRKNVLAKCYGGDITRKRKLLEKQKEGKKRMKMVGRVEVPQEAFLAVLKVEE